MKEREKKMEVGEREKRESKRLAAAARMPRLRSYFSVRVHLLLAEGTRSRGIDQQRWRVRGEEEVEEERKKIFRFFFAWSAAARPKQFAIFGPNVPKLGSSSSIGTR